MQAITALAHLRAAVLYVMDVSEQCGHGLREQLELFQNIQPLFINKVSADYTLGPHLQCKGSKFHYFSSLLQPLIVVANKCDVRRIAELSEDDQVSPLMF